MNEKTLKETFPEYLYSPLWFDKMTTAPWFEEIVPQQLAIKYVGQRSGSKLISPLLDDLLKNEDTNIFTVIANVLTSCENYRWIKLWNTLNFEYNPIENYNMKESSTDTRDGSTDNTDTIKNTRTVSETTTVTNDSTVDNSIYGFNSTTSVDSDSSIGTTNGTSTKNTTDGDDETRSVTTTVSDKNEHALTRSGNIGVTTTQQMITQERELVLWKFFDEVVFADIDKYLVCPIYK